MKRSERVAEAQAILKGLGLPRSQQNQISALTLLALCGVRINDPWNRAKREGRTVTKGVMDFIRDKYKISYAPNTRETVRRQVLHQFVLAGVAEYNPFDLESPTNSPRADPRGDYRPFLGCTLHRGVGCFGRCCYHSWIAK